MLVRAVIPTTPSKLDLCLYHSLMCVCVLCGCLCVVCCVCVYICMSMCCGLCMYSMYASLCIVCRVHVSVCMLGPQGSRKDSLLNQKQTLFQRKKKKLHGAQKLIS